MGNTSEMKLPVEIAYLRFWEFIENLLEFTPSREIYECYFAKLVFCRESAALIMLKGENMHNFPSFS